MNPVPFATTKDKTPPTINGSIVLFVSSAIAITINGGTRVKSP